jgi:hypothetical protein
MYKYVDEKGSVHATDSYGNIPEDYRSSAKDIRVDSRTYGYTPSVNEAIGSERFATDAWFDYRKMPIYERWFLLARAGFMDIVPIFKAMVPWMGLFLFVLISAYFMIFKVFSAPAIRGSILMLVFVLATGGLFFKYIRVVEGQSKSLVQKVRRMRNADAERQKRMLGVLESVQREGR